MPIDIKTELIDRLLMSIHKTDDSIDNLWVKEINKRRVEIEKGDVSLVDGEEVFKKIQQRFS